MAETATWRAPARGDVTRYGGRTAHPVPTPAHVLGRLADEARLRVLAAIVLGASTFAAVTERSGLTDDEAARALAQLLTSGLVVQVEHGLAVDLDVFARTARAASTPRKPPDLSGATPEQASVLRNFLDADGRLGELPARAARRRLVLEYVAGRFEPDRQYPEREVNTMLMDVHDDFASLRRFLVDEGFLEREGGVYRRIS